MLICVSRFTRSQILKSITLAPERAVVLSNTVDPRFNVEGREAARAKFGFGPDLTLLTVGRLDVRERYKGHDRVISILRQLQREIGRSIVYVIAGDGDDRSRLETMAKEAGLANEVRFLGRVASADLPDLYRAVDLFVMPSTGEGFGIVFLEAMGCGTPALGLGAGGANDPLCDGLLGHVTSEADLLTGLLHALTRPQPNPNLLSDEVQQRFGRQAFARATAGAISRLVETA
jgi:phosphatidylinositol alpha-1,6-mannosyltransferase